MAIIGELMTILSGNHAPLMASLAQSEAAMKAYAANTGVHNANVASSFAPIAAAATVAGLVSAAGLAVGVNAAADFHDQLNTINTIARLTPNALDDVGMGIRKLALESGADLNDLTASFYDLLSVGVPLGDTNSVLAAAVNLSIGGLGTANEAVTAITGSINAWSGAQGAANLKMTDGTKVANMLAKAIELGDIKTHDLPAALANVAPLAANFNMAPQEVLASLALMSTKFIAPTEGATALNAALVALERRPPGMEHLEQMTGKAYETIARTQSPHQAMMELVADAEKFNVHLVDVFGRVDALPFVLGTTGSAAGQFGDFLAQTLHTADTASEQARIRMVGFNFELERARSAVKDLEISIGDGFLPVATPAVEALDHAAQGAAAWAHENPGLASSILEVTLMVSGLTLGLKAVAGAAGALNPLAIVIAGIAASAYSIEGFLERNNALAAAGQSPAQIEATKYYTSSVFGQQDMFKHTGHVPPVTDYMIPGDTISERHGIGASMLSAVPPIRDFARAGGQNAGPIHLHNHVTLKVDGRDLAQIIDEQLYELASVSSSGFSGGQGARER